MQTNSYKRASGLIGLLAVLLMAAACSPAGSGAPTPDVAAVRTEAAQTVVAQLTLEAALNPSPTVEIIQPASATPEPVVITATPVVLAAEMTNTATALPPPPTATRRAASSSSSSGSSVSSPTKDYQAQFLDYAQSPQDGAKMKPGQEFNATWMVKNTGKKTWNKNYYYRFVGGEKMSELNRYYLGGDVATGDTVTLIADMVAPVLPGLYTSEWELVNDNGARFAKFFVAITVE